MRQNMYNPDVLVCIANLSNDEVFTPPQIANKMLDQVAAAWAADNNGENIWQNPEVKFLDPFVKSGIFLREITGRLVQGLAHKIPDLQERVNHVLTKQVYGIAITELTALLARRSVYCAKKADGKYSVCTAFNSEQGNIWFARTEHKWQKTGSQEDIAESGKERLTKPKSVKRCVYCGANSHDYDRGQEFETHAYAFIHTDNIKNLVAEIFGDDMHFDVVIGNPPYQLSDGGHGKSAKPIYQEFVEQAKKLEPRYLSMIIPSRWFTGGKGLDTFREEMLHDDRLRSINDYLNASDVFSGIGLKGGVCYFLWNRDTTGPCTVTTHFNSAAPSVAVRPLLEDGVDVFIRFNQGVSVLRKVLLANEKSFEQLVSARKPFGIVTNFRGNIKKMEDDDLVIFQNGGQGFIANSDVQIGRELIDVYKVFVGRAAPGTGNRDTYPHRIISTPFAGKPGEICSETYLCIAPFKSPTEVDSVLSYLKCKFTRFLILLHKASQDTTRKVYGFVPMQSWDRIWTDEELYKKYGITEEEIEFIESVVRPMEEDS